MLDININTLSQSFWILLNFGAIYYFFLFYFYPKITKNIKERIDAEQSKAMELKYLDEKVNLLKSEIENYNTKIITYKQDKISQCESEIIELKKQANKELEEKYSKMKLSHKEILAIDDQSTSEELMLKYAKIISERIINQKVEIDELKHMYNKMKINK